MLIDPKEVSTLECYHLMTATIVPRPIAWISTCSSSGVDNLAPYSFFNGVTSSPATLLFTSVNNRFGNKKDTVRNIEENKQFVVNIVSYPLAQKMVATSNSFEYGVSEFNECGIESESSLRITPKRVANSPIAFECELDRIVEVGNGPGAAQVVLGRILLIHVSDDILDSDSRVDFGKLDAVGRMGYESYVRTLDCFNLKQLKTS